MRLTSRAAQVRARNANGKGSSSVISKSAMEPLIANPAPVQAKERRRL